VLIRKAYGGGYLAMSGAPMKPDAVIALPTAKPALMGPDAAVNGILLCTKPNGTLAVGGAR